MVACKLQILFAIIDQEIARQIKVRAIISNGTSFNAGVTIIENSLRIENIIPLLSIRIAASIWTWTPVRASAGHLEFRIAPHLDAVKADLMVTRLKSQGDSATKVRDSFEHRRVEIVTVVKLETVATGQVRNFLGRNVVEFPISSHQGFVKRFCLCHFVPSRGGRLLICECQAIHNSAGNPELFNQCSGRGRTSCIPLLTEKKNYPTKTARFALQLPDPERDGVFDCSSLIT
jgi:hypothetical protein